MPLPGITPNFYIYLHRFLSSAFKIETSVKKTQVFNNLFPVSKKGKVKYFKYESLAKPNEDPEGSFTGRHTMTSWEWRTISPFFLGTDICHFRWKRSA